VCVCGREEEREGEKEMYNAWKIMNTREWEREREREMYNVTKNTSE
jgi:hypothetical protein